MSDNSQRLGSPHGHVFLGENHRRNEFRTWLVIALTAATMVAEIVAGSIYGSMALVADGWHMSTHAAAMSISAIAYVLARRHAHNPCFTFGTGKFGDLAAFASAILLGLVALLIGWESLVRLYSPVAIDFTPAMIVAVVGLVVNLACAWLLQGDHAHHGHGHAGHHHDHGHRHDAHHHHDGDTHTDDHAHDHAGVHGSHHHDQEDHHHGHDEHHHGHVHAGRDNALRAAFLHVLADALTSVLAIVALLLGSWYGWSWLDPAIGVVGAVVILQWAIGLMRDAGRVLVDYVPEQEELPEEIRHLVEDAGDTIADLHVWQVGPGHHAAILSVRTAAARDAEFYRTLLRPLHDLSHLTVEIDCSPTPSPANG